jgi:tetratricopeptide (TPR) repeat protein
MPPAPVSIGMKSAGAIQAVKLDNRAIEARNALAVLYSRQGRFADGVTALRAAASQSSAAYLHNNLGYLYYLQGNHVAAITELRIAISLDPQHEWARNNLRLAAAALDRVTTRGVALSPVRAESAAGAIEVWGEIRGRHGEIGGTVAAAREAAPERAASSTSELALRTAPAAQVSKQSEWVAEINRDLAKMPTGSESAKIESSVKAYVPEFGDASSRKLRLEVSNGNGVTGFAKRMSEILVRQGIPVHSLTNHLPYEQLRTEIQYRDGFEQEAVQLKARLGGSAVVAHSKTLRPHIDLRVLLGQDITTRIAEIETSRPARVAISN